MKKIIFALLFSLFCTSFSWGVVLFEPVQIIPNENLLLNSTFDKNGEFWQIEEGSIDVIQGQLVISERSKISQKIIKNLPKHSVYEIKINGKYSGDNKQGLFVDMSYIYTDGNVGSRSIEIVSNDIFSELFVPFKDIKELIVTIRNTCNEKFALNNIDFLSLKNAEDSFAYNNMLFKRVSKSKKDYTRSDTVYKTKDGFGVGFTPDGLATLNYTNNRIYLLGTSGFMALDYLNNSGIIDFEPSSIGKDSFVASSTELELDISAKIESFDNYIKISGRLTDKQGKNRNIMLAYGLPVGADLNTEKWIWCNDIKNGSQINPDMQEYSNTFYNGNGMAGKQNMYPIGAIMSMKYALAFGIDPDVANTYRICYLPAMNNFQINFDMNIPAYGSGDFSFIVYRFSIGWGFRSAFDKYSSIFSEYFPSKLMNTGFIADEVVIDKLANMKELATYILGNKSEGFLNISPNSIDMQKYLFKSTSDILSEYENYDGVIINNFSRDIIKINDEKYVSSYDISNNEGVYSGIIETDILRQIKAHKMLFLENVNNLYTFSIPYFDGIIFDINVSSNGLIDFPDEDYLLYLRAIAFKRPVFARLVTDGNITISDYTVKAFLGKCCAYGFIPNFSNEFLTDPSYAKDRNIIAKYYKALKEVISRQWNSIPYAEVNNSSLSVERFGTGNEVFLLIHNKTDKRQVGTLTIYDINHDVKSIMNILDNSNYIVRNMDVNLTLNPYETIIFKTPVRILR